MQRIFVLSNVMLYAPLITLIERCKLEQLLAETAETTCGVIKVTRTRLHIFLLYFDF